MKVVEGVTKHQKDSTWSRSNSGPGRPNAQVRLHPWATRPHCILELEGQNVYVLISVLVSICITTRVTLCGDTLKNSRSNQMKLQIFDHLFPTKAAISYFVQTHIKNCAEVFIFSNQVFLRNLHFLFCWEGLWGFLNTRLQDKNWEHMMSLLAVILGSPHTFN